MHLARLDLQNFRCFEHRTVVFDKRFTLLIGANATGKTAVLDALAVALGAVMISIPRAKSRQIRHDDVRRTYLPTAETGHFEEHYPAVVTAHGSVGPNRLIWARELRTANSHTTYGAAKSIRDAMHALVQQSRHGEEVIFPCVSFYGTGRLWLEQRQRLAGGVDPGRKISRYAGYRNCLTPRSSTRDLVAWVKRLTLIQAQRGTTLETLKAMIHAIVRCVDHATDAYFDFDQDDIVITFPGNVRFPFNMLSDGQRNMAAIAADIAMRCSQLNPHLNGAACRQTPGVVLIDEIDLHLHPRWQRSVVSDLRESFPNMQFIATSHSPFIIQSMAQQGSVINLDAEHEESETLYQQSIEDVAENIMGVEQPQRSRRFQDMVAAAEKYFRAIENTSMDDPGAIRVLRDNLDRLEEPFADNPAYVAFLRLKRPRETWSE